MGVVAENFFAKSAGSFTPLIEIKHNSVSLCWNFYAYMQLIRWKFWLQLWTVKKFSEPHVSWKYLAKMWKKIGKEFGVCSEPATSKGAAYWLTNTLCCACLFIACL